MTRGIKVIFTTAAFIGLVVGSIFGYRDGRQGSDSMESAAVMSADSATADFARQQFGHADANRARAAVLIQIRIMEQLQRTAHDPRRESKLGWAYARLAMIEEADHRQGEARRAFDEARNRIMLVHPGATLTDDDIKAGVKRIDDLAARVTIY